MSSTVFRKPVLAAGLALLLAGCEHGSKVGVGAGTSEEGSQESGSALERVKELLFTRSSANAIEIPLAGVLNEGLLDDYKPFQADWSVNKWSVSCYALGMPERFKGQSFKDQIALLGGFLDSLGKSPAGSLQRAMFEDYQYVKTFNEATYPRLCALMFTYQTVQPMVGWPGDMSGDGHKHNLDFTTSLMVPAIASNNINTVIASKLGRDTWSDDNAVKTKANAILDDMVKTGQVTGMVRDAVLRTTQVYDGRSIVVDYTGHSADPVHFQTPSYDFRGNGNGLQYSKSGITWFGDGYYSGKKYMVTVETLAAGSMTKRSSLSDSQATKSAQHQDSAVNVQN